MNEEYTLIIKVRKLGNKEQVKCFDNSELCDKEHQVHIIGEAESSKIELYLCGLHFALRSLAFHNTALEEASKK